MVQHPDFLQSLQPFPYHTSAGQVSQFLLGFTATTIFFLAWYSVVMLKYCFLLVSFSVHISKNFPSPEAMTKTCSQVCNKSEGKPLQIQ
jgi:hypothetical protein